MTSKGWQSIIMGGQRPKLVSDIYAQTSTATQGESPPVCPVSAENCPYVREAAEVAVKRVFAILGVDVSDPPQVAAFQENLRFGATLRRAADRFVLAIIALFGASLGGALLLGIAAKLKSVL